MRMHFSQTQLHVWLQKYMWRQFALTTEDAATAVFFMFPTLLGVQGFWMVYQEASVIPDVSYSPLGTCPFSTEEPGSQLLQECFYR